MGYPPGIGTCLVTADLRDVTQGGIGLDEVEVDILLPVQLVDATDKVIVPAAKWSVETEGGILGVQLPFNDNPEVQPSGWAYTFYIKVPGAASFMVEIPRSTGPTADLATLVPVGSSTPVWANAPFVPLADYTTKGDLVAATAAGAVARVPVGADGTALTADSTQPTGMRFAAVATTPAWQFNPYSYGAKGDGQIVTDGAISIGTNALACTTSTPFRAGDVGKAIKIKGAAALGVTTLVTTITGYTDNGHVTIGANAATTVSGALVTWATDDTAALLATEAAALSFANSVFSADGLAQILMPPNAYGVAGPLVTGGTTKGNAQWPLPIIQTGSYGQASGNKVVLDITGPDNGAPVRHWQQLVPNTAGATLLSFGVFSSISAQVSSLNAAGSACVIGGPGGAEGYGTGAMTVNGNQPSVYSNMMIKLRNLNIVTTHSVYGLGYGAFNFHGIANAYVENVAIGTDGTAAAGDFNNPITFANGASIGGIMPASGNNDSCQMRNIVVQGGYTYGLYATEHTLITGGTILFNWAGYCPIGSYGDGGSPTGALHGTAAPLLSLEGNTWPVAIIGAGAGGVGPQISAVLDMEQVTRQFRDQSSGTGLGAAVGEIRLIGAGGTISTTAPTGLVIIDELQAPGVVAQVPLTLNTPVQSPYWRRARVLLAGGTVTAVKVSSLMGGSSAPAMTTYYSQASGALPLISVPLNPGAWIEVDGSVLPTTNTWTLE